MDNLDDALVMVTIREFDSEIILVRILGHTRYTSYTQ